MNRVLVDSGPLVAILSPSDSHHEACLGALPKMPRPLLTCWPVITEVCWILQRHPQSVRELLKRVGTGFLNLLPLRGEEGAAISETMEAYEDLRPDFADACLVYLSHREQITTIFTLDRRDFSVYRRSGKKHFQILP